MLDELRAPPARGELLAELHRLRDEYAPMGLNVDIVADGVADHDLAAVGGADNVSAAIVACVREGLTNAVRHAHASEATVGVHRDGEHLEVQVFDNGSGRVEVMTEGYGLLGIRVRAAQVGGTVSLSDYPEGLKLTMSFSLNGATKPNRGSGS